MKTSLVIPCTPQHFVESLPSVLKAYSNSTKLPDEVVISLSEARLVQRHSMSLDDAKFLSKCVKNEIFENFILLSHYDKKSHGPNRQAGSKVVTGDLIIYNDADDFPHPQRVEIIEYFFENHNIVHLNHGWIPAAIDFENFEKTNISYINSEDIYKKYFPNNEFSDCLGASNYGAGFVCTHGGNTSILKKVLEKVRWKDWNELIGRAEDYEFCMEVAYNFKKSMIIDVPLIHYTNPSFENLSLHDLGYK